MLTLWGNVIMVVTGTHGDRQMQDTPFITFWRALNEHLESIGYPQISYGPARRLWDDTAMKARREIEWRNGANAA